VCICLNKMRCQFFIDGKKVDLFAMTEQQHLSLPNNQIENNLYAQLAQKVAFVQAIHVMPHQHVTQYQNKTKAPDYESPDYMRKEKRNKRKMREKKRRKKRRRKERGADCKKEEEMSWVGGTGGRPWVGGNAVRVWP
jgi:hypothetical protein